MVRASSASHVAGEDLFDSGMEIAIAKGDGYRIARREALMALE
jgi:biotin operon repressor